MAEIMTPMRKNIVAFIADYHKEHGFPPSMREVAQAVGLRSTATVKAHLDVLRDADVIRVDEHRARTINLNVEPAPVVELGNLRQIPLVGDVAAGTGVLAEESSDELVTLPEQFAGRGESFMLRVRGESMIDAGILPGDFVVVNRQETANKGEIVVAGIPGEEATVKRFFPQGSRIILQPENATMEPMEFDANEVVLYGKVISVLRNY